MGKSELKYRTIDLFTMAYQPIIDLKNGKVYGYEALLRPRGGKKPEDLIKKAEMSGLLLELEILICSTIAELIYKRNDDSVVFINLTPHSFVHNNGLTVMEALSSLDPEKVVIEITEAMRLPNDVSEVVKMWRNNGYKLAVDDISQGYSRLSAVAEVMPDFIKIDRTCIAGAPKFCAWEKILEGIVHMARSVKAKTIGEGIETEEEKGLIIKHGIDYGQGYYFGRPAIIGKNFHKVVKN